MTKTIHHPAYEAMIRRLRRRRVELGLTQREVARKLGVATSWVCKVETCERRLDFLETIDVCRLYRIAVSELERCVRQRQEERP